MKIFGQLQELSHQYDDPIQYFLQVDQERINLNQFLGTNIKLKFLDKINCIYCGRKIKKSYNNGFCYPCFKKLPQNDLCIVKPNLCHFEGGTCRDNSYGDRQCMVPHYVYLALSSDVKVGLTRKTNSIKRWIDQGAIQSVPIAELPTRKEAGELEFLLSKYLPDKTNWRKMLKGEISNKDILSVKEEITSYIPEKYSPYILQKEEIREFKYPILEFAPEKIVSITFDKQSELAGRLLGIKGQYLLFDVGVLNIKKHAGYNIEVEFI
ncbi:hypothetical protein BHF71_02180 [Vulcanibacillus modesticaldus]|uniref:DUF2797 domain-containing protein n=1 Tax=Vulcanibacillus modesticaldus TaxID=337097 RepID=A0A1D2YUR5_9BACI|nr:DUF2797 domain-containing protein [Vulcanibacillus modesticaldus]OEF99413.1 hypothetical protein BHF71_02180 [Vulcanibacillus modesticaldus]